MPLIDYLKVYRARVQPALDQGERLLDLGSYASPMIGDTHRLDRPDRDADDRLIRGVRLIGGVQVNFDRIDRFFGGVSGVGRPGSIAAQLWRAAEALPSAYYAVTDRRLLVLTQPTDPDKPFEIRYAIDRSTVVTARRSPKLLLGRGRVELTFNDGSMVTVLTGMLWPARARSFVAAIDPSAG